MDATDFDMTLRRLSPKLKSIAHRLNGNLTYFDEDDLYQEAIVHLWLHMEKGDLNDKTDSYILQGCYYHLKNHLRVKLDKARLASISEPIDDDSTLEEMLTKGTDAEIEKIDSGLLAEAISGRELSEREGRVLGLLLDGHTVRETGEALGISHVMVLKIKARIREKCAGLDRYASN